MNNSVMRGAEQKLSRALKASLTILVLTTAHLIVALVAFGLLTQTRVVSGWPDDGIGIVSPGRASGPTTPADGIVIDHRHVGTSAIPQQWLDQVRSLDTLFAHMSVGDNILDGMADLQAQDPARYSLAVYSGGADWFVSNSGILHRPLGSNFDPLTKTANFDSTIRDHGYHVADIAMMKFCPGDLRPDYVTITGQEIWDAYRPMMEALEETYPGVTFVWWTFPLSSVTQGHGLGNDEKAVFNAAVRAHCDANGCALFDIADMQSHDPSGIPVVDGNGYEAMWDGYTDDGGHLDEVGRQRVATAMWWLLTRVAGWTGTTTPPMSYWSYLPLVLK